MEGGGSKKISGETWGGGGVKILVTQMKMCSYHKNRMTTLVVTLWHVYVASLTTSVFS